MIWFLLAGMAALAALAALWPVLRKPAAALEPNADFSETAFYKAQLEEIQRDVERGQLPQSEAEAARAETARRLIALRRAAPENPKEGLPRPRDRRAAAALIAVGLPAVSISLYGLIGHPLMPDEPLASRHELKAAESDVVAAVAGVEAHLMAKPDDGRGWAVIAPVYMRLERYEDAAHAYSEALRLLGENASRRAGYGEAVVAAEGGVVSEKAREAFDKALADEPGQPQARFYLALGAEQDGKTDEAIRDYESLLRDAPPAASWAKAVRDRLAALKGEVPQVAAEASPAIPAAQRPMIEGMVSQLASRLASAGGGVEDWARLIRAYAVLHEADKAKAALADARKALAPNANAVASLDALARDLGLGGAN